MDPTRTNIASAPASLSALLADGLVVAGADEIAAPFLPQLTVAERGVQAVILYGSALWGSVRQTDSHPDFLVVIDDGAARFWERSLPPTVYRVQADAAAAKVCVVTASQLRDETGPRARDLHLAGRLCKRVALVWFRDPDARARVLAAQASALETVGQLTLARVQDTIDLDGFVRALLGLSYESEVRLVEPGKVTALFDAERSHYRAVGRAVLDRLRTAPAATPSRAAVSRLLRRSRRRALLRWPKYVLTYDGWLDYLLSKAARSGEPMRLTERQRRYPLPFAVPVLYRLIRSKRVR